MAHGVPEKYIKGGVIVGLVEKQEAPKEAEPEAEPKPKTRKPKGEG